MNQIRFKGIYQNYGVIHGLSLSTLHIVEILEYFVMIIHYIYN